MIRDTIITELESFEEDQDDSSPSEAQPPLSPAGGAESLFLAGLATSKISADALSSKLRHAHKYSFGSLQPRRSPSGASIRSALTDDFHSCAEFSDDIDEFPLTDNDNEDDETFFSIFRRKTPTNSNMSATSSSKRSKKANTAPVTNVPEAEAKGMDVAEHVYEKAKDIWAWGKGVPVVSIGLGITEAVVGKAVKVALGTDFEGLDNQIKPQLGKLDHDVINPAIEAVVSVAMNAANKSEGVLKPILIKFLSPFGLIKNEAENPELTTE